MELWAYGFNAWGQLDFANAESLSSDGMPEQDSLPKDLKQFECVLSDNEIDVLKTSISSTLGECRFATNNRLVTCHDKADGRGCPYCLYSFQTVQGLSNIES
jgi:hypothetical protein